MVESEYEGYKNTISNVTEFEQMELIFHVAANLLLCLGSLTDTIMQTDAAADTIHRTVVESLGSEHGEASRTRSTAPSKVLRTAISSVIAMLLRSVVISNEDHLSSLLILAI
jgi:hypothetical protein